MSITAFLLPGTRVLTVLGDQGDNIISVGRNSAGDLLVNGGAVQIFGRRASASSVDTIAIAGLGGNDTLKIDETNGVMPKSILLGGEGNDTLIGGSGLDYLFGEGGHDFIDGNGGNDVAWMGTGDDTFQWDPGDGSDRIEGGAGLDRMIFNGSAGNEVFDASASGSRLRFFRNLGNIVMDTDDLEQIDLNALGGTDQITINNLAATDVKTVNLNLAGLLGNSAGDTQADTVIINGTDLADTINVAGAAGSNAYQVTGLAAAIHVTGTETIDRLTIQGLGGDDRISAQDLAANVTQLTLDGGNGNDFLTGSRGIELLLGGDGNDVAIGLAGNDVAFMGAGDDQFIWNPGDGSDTVEGQLGSDTMVFNGSNVSEKFSLSANGGRAIFFRDVANITMDLDDVETIELNALGGADTVVLNDVSGTDLKTVKVNFAALGGALDGQVDRLIMNGTTGDDTFVLANSGNEISILGLAANVSLSGFERSDSIEINGLLGDDIFDASLLTLPVSIVFSGDAGDDIMLGGINNERFLGGDGDDVVTAGAGDDFLDGGLGDDVLLGDAGNDVLINGEISIQ